ncbi:hypothetical protein GEMRC1_001130 [Eukaryota sp. GEM-RC1]
MTSTQIAPASLCNSLFQTSLKQDFVASFKDLQIPCHSVVLVQFSEFFIICLLSTCQTTRMLKISHLSMSPPLLFAPSSPISTLSQ